MAHRDRARRAAESGTGPTGAPPAEAGPVDAAPKVEAHAPGPTAADHPPRQARPQRTAPAWTPAFGLTLAAMRQRNAATAEGTAEIRRSLAAQEAQTNELREALDALRRTLDDTAPPSRPVEKPPVNRRRWRRRLLLIAVLAVLAVAGTFLLTRGDGAGTVAAPPSAPSTNPAVGPSGTTAPAPAVSITPMPWRDGLVDTPPGLPATGPGVDSPGTDVSIAIDRDLTHIDIYERVVLSSARPSLALALPGASAWGSTLAGAAPVIEGLQVVLDGVAVRPTPQGAGWFATPAAGKQVTTAVLRYRVSGTSQNVSGPNSPRRLIGVPTFTGQVSSASAVPVIMRIDDPRVLSLSCLGATGGSTVCQQQSGTIFTARFPPNAGPVAVLSADVAPLR